MLFACQTDIYQEKQFHDEHNICIYVYIHRNYIWTICDKKIILSNFRISVTYGQSIKRNALWYRGHKNSCFHLYVYISIYMLSVRYSLVLVFMLNDYLPNPRNKNKENNTNNAHIKTFQN